MSADPWIGALGADGATVVARLSGETPAARLAVTDPADNVVYSSSAASSGRVVRLSISGLAADTEYTYAVESVGEPTACPTGRFRTPPAGAGDPASFTVAFGGDANSGSDANVFNVIRESDPLLFIHLGDLHYSDINTNSQALYHAAYDGVFACPRQAQLYRDVPTAYAWDDHDYANNNSNGSAASHDAACAVYRSRVPHYTLADATVTAHIGQTWDIGRVRFILTDQRSAASANAATDNSSKTMLGTSQKTWFKNLLANSPGMLIVWICPRHFSSSAAVAGSDTWAGFSTERDELGAHIAANCAGRVVVLSADMHSLGIDDGSAHTFSGAVLPTFQCAPLDRPLDLTPSEPPGEFSEGWFNSNGQWGSMQIVDGGGSSISVTWRGHDAAGSTILTYAFSVSV